MPSGGERIIRLALEDFKARPTFDMGWWDGTANANTNLVIRIGAKIVTRARNVIFQMAEVAAPSELLQEILRLIDGLRPRPVPE